MKIFTIGCGRWGTCIAWYLDSIGHEVTLFSDHSHNRTFGMHFVCGQPYDKLAEGYYTVKALVNLGKRYEVELPICEAVYEILYEEKDPEIVLKGLFSRNLKREFG